MSIVRSLKKEKLAITKFLDWDKYKNEFYNNFYLDDYKFVIKIPLIPKNGTDLEVKIKKFDLTKYIYLISYD